MSGKFVEIKILILLIIFH